MALLSGRKKQCNLLLELLKRFQSCRALLSSSLQRAEQAVNEQASYVSKDYLQRSIAKVTSWKRSLHACEDSTHAVPLIRVCLLRSVRSRRGLLVWGKRLRR